jgi:HK97 family phage major capsid protein
VGLKLLRVHFLSREGLIVATEADLLKRLGNIEAALEKAASTPASKAGTPASVFGSFQKRGDNSWPVERLEALSKAYNHDGVTKCLARDGRGLPRGIGWGPALKRLAEISNPSIASDKNYGLEQLENEHGFVTMQAAATRGIKQLNGEVRKTALAEGSGLTGGYIVPPQFMNELLTIAAEDAFIEPRAKVIPMTSRTMTIPMLDITTVQAKGTSPYFGGILAQWQPEAATINETEPQFKQSEWVAWDLVLYSVSSNQLLADNGIGLDALLTQLFAQAITWYKEYAFLRGLGAGSSMPLGILNAPATYSYTKLSSSLFQLPDAAGMMAQLQVRSWDDACWIMHQSVLPQLIKMTDYAGASNSGTRLVWTNPAPPGDVGPMAMKLPQAFLNGLPIYFTEKLPQLGTAGSVCLVDWSRYVIGQRMDLQIDVSPHYLFRNNQLAWRVVARCDGRPWLNNSITDAEGWTVSPFVITGNG